MELFTGLFIGFLCGILVGAALRSKQIYNWPHLYGYKKTRAANKYGTRKFDV